MDNRTDTEILDGRVTMMLYHKKMRFIFDNIFEGDFTRFGIFFRAIIAYTETLNADEYISKEEDPILWSAFQQIKYDLDADAKRYIERSRKNSENGRKRKKAKED